MHTQPTAILADLDGAADALAQSAEAAAQRLIVVPTTTQLTDCTCGLLLAPLPNPVTLTRTYAFGPRPTTRDHTITHAHVANPDSNPACHICLHDLAQCSEHGAHMCDIPEPRTCTRCTDPVRPGHTTCPHHTPDQAEREHHTPPLG